MTVEASIVLPLFLFFFLNLSSAIEMIRLHGNLELALWNIGNRMSVYGYALEGTQLLEGSGEAQGNEWWQQMSGIAFSYTYVKRAIKDYLGTDYLEGSPLLGGADGLQFLESDIFTKDDTFEIVVAYGVQPFTQMAGFVPFGMVNHYYGHVWNGYELPKEGMEPPEDVVYVTECGSVYHEDAACTHLKLSVRQVSGWQAVTARNLYGEKYQMCELCAGHTGKEELMVINGFRQVWITEEGNKIHLSEQCSGLKRTVMSIDRSEAEKFRPCSRCAR